MLELNLVSIATISKLDANEGNYMLDSTIR